MTCSFLPGQIKNASTVGIDSTKRKHKCCRCPYYVADIRLASNKLITIMQASPPVAFRYSEGCLMVDCYARSHESVVKLELKNTGNNASAVLGWILST